MRRAARVDSNHKDIITVFRKCGAYVLDTSQLKEAFDCLVVHRGKTFIVEIKDGLKPPSKRKLTDGEIKCKNDIEAVGGKYHIIKSEKEAIDLLR